MPGRIRILGALLASKIAAGEVVDRPASVVKELIENSVDADARSISVTVEEGGRRLIRVSDDGEGMSREDAPAAFVRHATSKIEKEEDLYSITTLGFRGEALASISAVSRVLLKTRRETDVTGTEVEAEGVAVPLVRDAGCVAGTVVEVRDLFHNTPARLKFLKSDETEFARVADVVRRAALANPHIRFRLFNGRNRAIDAPPGGLKARIADVLSGNRRGELIEVSSALVNGFVGGQGHEYATSRAMYLFVNRRPVRDGAMTRAIMDAYGTLMEAKRYPLAVIDIEVPPEDVDCNIHPAKSEVRFRNPGLVYDSVKAAVKAALNRPSLPGVAPSHQTLAWGREEPSWAAVPSCMAMERAMPYGSGQGGSGHSEDFGNALGQEGQTGLRSIGQLWGEFIVAESAGAPGQEGALYIIDAHGAAERCAFERLKARYYGEGVGSQMLLIPERVETTPEEKDALNRALDGLKRLGFVVMPFGPSVKAGGETFLIKAVPYLLSARSSAGLIKDLAEDLADAGRSSRVEGSIEAALMRIACHSVIRGERALTREESDALLSEVASVDFSGHCPHGRPVVKAFTRAEVEAMFKRS
jgi:DNA mismatch repair protein MutL